MRGDTPVYTEPTSTSEQVCVLPNGTHADVLEAPSRTGGTWLKVRADAWTPPAGHVDALDEARAE